MRPATLGGSCERGKVPPWKPSTTGRSAQKWKLRGSEKSTAVSLRQANRETSIEDPGHPYTPSPRNKSATVCRGWVLKLGFQRTDLRRALGLAIQREPEKAGMSSKQQLMYSGRSLCLPLKPHC